MPTDSRKVRKLRRIKRERSLAFAQMEVALWERNQARMVAIGLEQELKKYVTKYGELTPEVKPEGVNSVADQLTQPEESSVE